jgi:hypothetical protein
MTDRRNLSPEDRYDLDRETAIAEHRALAFAEQSRTDNTGNDQ